MRKILSLNVIAVIALGGCLHAPADYPGAPGSSIDPAQYVDVKCPDFSGTYEAVGNRVDGRVPAGYVDFSRRINLFDSVFPLGDSNDEWNVLRSNYRETIDHHIIVRPDFADVQQLSNRSVLVTIRYSDALVGSYHSDYSNTAHYVCVDGNLMFGGANKFKSYSEFGPNTSDGFSSIYLDKNGDLIKETRSHVHMNMALGLIPTGTAKYFSIYKYKRLSSQPGYKP
jgi:hypothetical protein